MYGDDVASAVCGADINGDGDAICGGDAVVSGKGCVMEAVLTYMGARQAVTSDNSNGVPVKVKHEPSILNLPPTPKNKYKT